MIKSVLLLISCLVLQTLQISNNDMRDCIEKSFKFTCSDQLQNCLSVDECRQEYFDLFDQCKMPLNFQEFNGICFYDQEKKIKIDGVKNVIHCFHKECNLLEFDPENMNYPSTDDLSNIETEYTRQRKADEETLACLIQSFKKECLNEFQECEADCLSELSKIRDCLISPDCQKDQIQFIIHEMISFQSKNLAQCVVDTCKIV